MKYLIISLLFSSILFSQSLKCTIKSVVSVNDKGEIATDNEKFALAKVGESFSVDRNTGKIIGSKLLANTNAGIPIITKQGKDNSFIVLTKHKSGDISLLKIKTWEEDMTFFYVTTSMGQVTGICNYYK